MTADISASADKFLCLADAFEAGLLFDGAEHTVLTSSLSSLTVLSNTDRSLSNNQIELLNKGMKCIKEVL